MYGITGFGVGASQNNCELRHALSGCKRHRRLQNLYGASMLSQCLAGLGKPQPCINLKGVIILILRYPQGIGPFLQGLLEITVLVGVKSGPDRFAGGVFRFAGPVCLRSIGRGVKTEGCRQADCGYP